MEEVSPPIRLSSKCVFEKDMDDTSIQWLGLDRYQKIIYGVQLSFPENSLRVELLKLCLFTRKASLFKRIVLENFEIGFLVRCIRNCKDVTKNGKFIGILAQTSSEGRNDKKWVEQLRFCLIEVETGDFQIYDISDPRENLAKTQLNPIEKMRQYCSCTDSMFCFCFWLKCRNENEWIVKLPLEKGIGRYYWLTLDKKTSQGFLNDLTENPQEGNLVYQHPLFLNGKLVIVTEANGVMAKINHFDFVLKQWKTVKTFHHASAPVSTKKHAVRQIFSQNGKDMLALMSPKEDGDRRCFFLKFDKQTNIWYPMNVLEYEIRSLCWHGPFVFPTTNFLAVLDFESFRLLETSSLYYTVFGVGNVLSLKDICFMKFFESYADLLVSLSEEEILRDTIFENLPAILKRHYWGPEYTWSKATAEDKEKWEKMKENKADVSCKDAETKASRCKQVKSGKLPKSSVTPRKSKMTKARKSFQAIVFVLKSKASKVRKSKK